MIELTVGDCRVSILPTVNGLVSEADRVRKEFGDYEAYAASLSIEGIQTLKNRAQIDEEFDVSELDLVYIKHMERFGEVEIPSPAMYTFIDAVKERGMNVIPLDMNDEDYTQLYCDTVKTLEFFGEHKFARKGMKASFDADTPEQLAKDWDDFLNTRKGNRELSEKREAYMADQIRDIARFKKSLLVIVEVERADGLVAKLR